VVSAEQDVGESHISFEVEKGTFEYHANGKCNALGVSTWIYRLPAFALPIRTSPDWSGYDDFIRESGRGADLNAVRLAIKSIVRQLERTNRDGVDRHVRGTIPDADGMFVNLAVYNHRSAYEVHEQEVVRRPAFILQ
jgi:hypothetical protein